MFCLHVPADGTETQPWTWQDICSAVDAIQTELQPFLGAHVAHVATITQPGLQHTIAMLACLATGYDDSSRHIRTYMVSHRAVCVPLDPSWPPARVAHILAHSNACAVLLGNDCR